MLLCQLHWPFADGFPPSRSISSAAVRKRLVDKLMRSFGLQDQANVIIGTPLRKGVSGGQKRRISVASQLVTGPKLLFLDEPVSGLDSTASREVISFIKDFAVKFQVSPTSQQARLNMRLTSGRFADHRHLQYSPAFYRHLQHVRSAGPACPRRTLLCWTS